MSGDWQVRVTVRFEKSLEVDTVMCKKWCICHFSQIKQLLQLFWRQNVMFLYYRGTRWTTLKTWPYMSNFTNQFYKFWEYKLIVCFLGKPECFRTYKVGWDYIYIDFFLRNRNIQSIINWFWLQTIHCPPHSPDDSILATSWEFEQRVLSSYSTSLPFGRFCCPFRLLRFSGPTSL